ncbi:aminotransferase-like domain-containing protein [Micromonospora sp. NBC_00421]|uniref:aminotransferase-like domain-containing protein n=1 Tax=Micromonospora sp. NBC_00421 TaxID=2975976 RepID=UPI002E1B34DE
MTLLDSTALHGSLQDPVLGSLSFLNEVMGRYPDAISFAPGAPHPVFFADFDPDEYVQCFLDHLVRDRGLDRTAARRRLYEYGPSAGIITDLVGQALRDDHGIEVDPASVVITVGAQEAMFLVLRALFAHPGDVLAVADPCFVGILGAARLLEVPVVGVPEGTDGIDVDRLEQECRAARRAGGRVRALYVSPDHANPGGSRMSLRCRHRLLELADREDFLVVEDNAYGFTSPAHALLPPLKALDRSARVVSIGTFAKICFPGARVGYVLADQWVTDGSTGRRERFAAKLTAIKSMVTVNTSPLCQAVIGGMLLRHGGSLAELGRRRAGVYQRNLGHLLDALDRHVGTVEGSGISWNHPDGGFFVRVHLPVPADVDLLEVSAGQYGVLWTPMAQFYLGHDGDHQLRLSCSYLDPAQIEVGVQRLATFFRKEISA